MNCPLCGVPFEGDVQNMEGMYQCTVCDFQGHLVEWDYGEPEDDEEPVA